MPPPDIGLLRRVADGAETPADRRIIAARVRAYLDAAPSGISLDTVFGLAPEPGQHSWHRGEALAARDAALRALAARFHGGQPIARQAEAIRAGLTVYAASAWRTDCRSPAPPARYAGTSRECEFDVLKACPTIPSARQIRRVLRP